MQKSRPSNRLIQECYLINEELEHIWQLYSKKEFEEAYELLERVLSKITYSYTFLYKKESKEKKVYSRLLFNAINRGTRLIEHEQVSIAIKEKLFYLFLELLSEEFALKGKDYFSGAYHTTKVQAIQLKKANAFIGYLDQKLLFTNEKEFYKLERMKMLYHAGRIEESMLLFNALTDSNKYFELADFYVKYKYNLSAARELIASKYELTFKKDPQFSSRERFKWQELMINLCEAENDMEQFKKCLLEIVPQEGFHSFLGYVTRLKELLNEEEWANLYTIMIDKCKRQDAEEEDKGPFATYLAWFFYYIEDYESLLAALQHDSFECIGYFHDGLLPEYKEELIDLYLIGWEKQLKESSKEENKDYWTEIGILILQIPEILEPLNAILYQYGTSFSYDGGSVEQKLFEVN